MATSEKLGSKEMSDEKSIGYFPLKMLEDKKTEMYVKFGKVMVIFQGPYIPERSRAVGDVKTKFKYCSRIISDETYRSERSTICRYEETADFYEYFSCESRRGLELANNLLVLDSTISNVLQNNYYLALAHKMQYVVLVMPPLVIGDHKCRWPPKSQAASFYESKTHIPAANNFQHLFCAWYLHDVDSFDLRNMAGLYLKDCVEDIDEFKEMFSRVDIPGEEVNIHMDAETFTMKIANKYFNLDDKWQDLAYCVTKVFNNQLFSMNTYFKTEDVIKNYGKMSKLMIAGFLVSPHMIAARVKLSFVQKNLWDMQDEMDENSKEPLVCPSDLLNSSKAELGDVDVQRCCTKSKPSMVNCGRTSCDPTENIPAFSKGRACHIVLAKAPRAPSRNVDFDVQFALRRMRKAGKDSMEKYNLERCIVRRLGKYWFIDLKEMLIIEGFFASCVKPNAYENPLNPAPRKKLLS